MIINHTDGFVIYEKGDTSEIIMTAKKPIQTTSRRGVDLVLNLLHHQGGAENSQKFLETEE